MICFKPLISKQMYHALLNTHNFIIIFKLTIFFSNKEFKCNINFKTYLLF